MPVILIDSKVDDPELVTCTITSNNYGAGLLDARHLISQTKNARIVLLSNSDSFSSWDRLSGLLPDPDQKRQRLPDPGAAGLRRRAEPRHARDGAAVGDVPAH
mgnify:FL=1